MKKLSLFMILTVIGTMSFAQVIFQVQTPSPLATNYGMTWAEPASSWGTADLLIPSNAVTGTLMFVDAPGGDTTACNTLTTSLTGKIAVLYRGACQFGLKALNAQNQGAIGVIIINNVSGAPIAMAGGTSGLSVTVPTIMITDVSGALLRDEIIAGNVDGFIGSKIGLFPDDLGAFQGDVVGARRFSNIAALSLNASEFSVQTGTWVRNFGNQTQNGASASVDITFGGSSVYSNTVAVNNLVPQDSIYVDLGIFSQAAYTNGAYKMTYTITTANPDGDLNDNVLVSDFMIDNSIYSYGRLDETTKEPLSPAGFRPATFTTDYENCLTFEDPNGSRVAAEGMTFSASTNTPDLLTGELVSLKAYLWNDLFTDINDANLGFTNLILLDEVFHSYSGDYQDSNIYVPFTVPIVLSDNQRYLFCFRTPSTTLFLGFDNELDYLATQDIYLQPSFPSTVDAQTSSFLNGFGTDAIPAITVTMGSSVGIEDIASGSTIVAYPNPATNTVNIPVGQLTGTAHLDVVDVVGKLVKSQEVSFDASDVLRINVSNLENGLYVFNLVFKDGTSTAFNMVVNH